MKKYVLVSKSFVGEMVFGFVDGLLVLFDISKAELNDKQREWVLKHIPMDEQALEFYNRRFSITEVEETVTFEMFWDKYNDKTNSSKKRTLSKWNRMPKSEQSKAYYYIDTYLRSIPNGCQKRYAETYLNAENWNN